MPGTYHLPAHTRGDSFPSFAIATLTDDATDSPIAVSSARMQVRAALGGRVLLYWSTPDGSITISGASNVITLGPKSAAIMSALPPGVLIYDLEVTLTTSGQTLTLLAGKWTIAADITR